MKKLWRKFKKWLIKKLGGYVDAPPHITQQKVQVSWIDATVRVNRWEIQPYFTDRFFPLTEDRNLKEKLAVLLARQILEGNLYHVEWSADKEIDAVLYRATVGVVKPPSASYDAPPPSLGRIGDIYGDTST